MKQTTENHRFSHPAMATIFEIIISHPEPNYARQAAWEAFRELDRLEQELSRFVDCSDIARINHLPPGQPLIIGEDAFNCLAECAELSAETNGAFDITVGALLNCWLTPDKSLRQPSPAELDDAREQTGMQFLRLNPLEFTVELEKSLQIDLGAFGKGYAVDRMAALLSEWEIDTFLIHGGTSSVLAGAAPPGKDGWPLSISSPFPSQRVIKNYHLREQAMSGSGLQKGQHILDPRTGQPLQNSRATWTFTPTAATGDALSTAFMVLTKEEIHAYCEKYPEIKAILLENSEEAGEQIVYLGEWRGE